MPKTINTRKAGLLLDVTGNTIRRYVKLGYLENLAGPQQHARLTLRSVYKMMDDRLGKLTRKQEQVLFDLCTEIELPCSRHRKNALVALKVYGLAKPDFDGVYYRATDQGLELYYKYQHGDDRP